MEILAAKKPTTNVQEFKNLKFRFKRGGEQVQASEHTENNNVQVHRETQMLHNKWKEKQVPVPKPSKSHRSKIQILHRKEQPDETRMRLSYAILSAATLVSNTQRDSCYYGNTCQPQSSGCEKVEQKPVLFRKKNSNRNRAPSSKNTNKRIRNGAELSSPETCEEASSAVGDDDDDERDGKEDEDNEQIGSTVQIPRSLPSDASEETKKKKQQQANFLFSVKIGKNS
jgi:hypothetical protein